MDPDQGKTGNSRELRFGPERSAAVFGVAEIIFGLFGEISTPSEGTAPRHTFDSGTPPLPLSLSPARSFLEVRGFDICAVEITDNAMAVNEHPFSRKALPFFFTTRIFPFIRT